MEKVWEKKPESTRKSGS